MENRAFSLVRTILRSEKFHALPLEDKTKTLSDILKTGDITIEQLKFLIDEQQQIEQQKQQQMEQSKGMKPIAKKECGYTDWNVVAQKGVPKKGTCDNLTEDMALAVITVLSGFESKENDLIFYISHFGDSVKNDHVFEGKEWS
jgi:hypothetical protein